jgi:hypothetical protein
MTDSSALGGPAAIGDWCRWEQQPGQAGASSPGRSSASAHVRRIQYIAGYCGGLLTFLANRSSALLIASASSSRTKLSGIAGGSATLQTGQGSPAPQLHSSGQDSRGWFSQTKRGPLQSGHALSVVADRFMAGLDGGASPHRDRASLRPVHNAGNSGSVRTRRPPCRSALP